MLSKVSPKDLEEFFMSLKNRIPQKSLSLIINDNDKAYSFDKNDENKKIIDKYGKLGG